MSFDDQIRDAFERATAGLRAQLERDLAAVAENLRHAAAEEQDRVAREAAEAAAADVRRQADAEIEELRRHADTEIAGVREAAHHDNEALKRALTDERERGAQQAAEAAAADMRRQAEMQAQMAQLQENARLQIEEIERAAADERDRIAQQAAHDAATEARRQADVQITELQENARLRIEEIERAAADERDRVAQRAAHDAAAEVRRQADGQIAQLRDAAQKQAEEIKRAAETQVSELRTTLQSQLDEVRRAAHTQTEEARRTAHSEIEDARRLASAQVDDVQRRAEEQLADTRRDLEAQIEEVRRRARAELEKARDDIETVRAEGEAAAHAARAEAEEVVIAQLTAAQVETEKKITQAVDRARTDEHQAELARTARLVDAIRRLDDARTLAESLDALAECAGRQVERAAVLVVRGDALRVHRLAGFSIERPTSDLDFNAAGLAGAVVRTGVTVSRSVVEPGDEQGTRQPALPSFAQDAGARHAVALPVIVGGHVVAVLYADAPRPETPSASSRWPATLEVIARHASRALEGITVQRATGLSVPRPASRPAPSALPGPVEHGGSGDEDSARRYARLLVSEIRMYHEPAVDEGRRSRDLRARLGDEIDRARRLYEERVSNAIRERSDYFEQELIRTLADGDRSLLG